MRQGASAAEQHTPTVHAHTHRLPLPRTHPAQVSACGGYSTQPGTPTRFQSFGGFGLDGPARRGGPRRSSALDVATSRRSCSALLSLPGCRPGSVSAEHRALRMVLTSRPASGGSPCIL